MHRLTVLTALTALTIHYSLHSPSDMNILFRAASAQQMLSHQHLTSKESFAQYAPLSLALSLSMCFSSHCTEVAEVLFIMSLANSLARTRESERGSCSLPRHENSFPSILLLGLVIALL